MNENYINTVLGEATHQENYTDFLDGILQLNKKKKHKKRKKKDKKKANKWKKRVKALEQQNDQIIAFLGIAVHQLKTPQANTWWQETVKNSAPKLIELGTEVIRGINQSKAPSTNNELYFSTEKK